MPTMKAVSILRPALAALLAATAGLSAAAGEDYDAQTREMMQSSFKENGIASKYRQLQLDFQKACSALVPPSAAAMKQIEAEQMQTVRWPDDGKFFGDWKEGEKIAQSGRGLTWTDKAGESNGGGCYNCHQLAPQELSFGTIGPSLHRYGKLRGSDEGMVKYTWGKLWNAKAYNACSQMPRMGDAHILSEAQIKHVMAYLFDPASPVNQ
ncbi:sulfur oxidation c-type cytochrome SoxX [Azoarcus sp. TTM-91]|nr:sulfur oxidation c-type cytochrome SoxX [Azoarcus sp. TTM-91]